MWTGSCNETATHDQNRMKLSRDKLPFVLGGGDSIVMDRQFRAEQTVTMMNFMFGACARKWSLRMQLCIKLHVLQRSLNAILAWRIFRNSKSHAEDRESCILKLFYATYSTMLSAGNATLFKHQTRNSQESGEARRLQDMKPTGVLPQRKSGAKSSCVFGRNRLVKQHPVMLWPISSFWQHLS